MKLGTRGRYAVMAMADLARAGGGPAPIADIAVRQDISASYLEQLFARLRRAGLVTAARGPGGGYALARDPAGISVAEVMAAVDEPFRTTRCAPEDCAPDDDEAAADPDACARDCVGCMADGARCLTHDLWADLGRHILAFLAAVSLDDVIAGRRINLFDGAAGAPGATRATATAAARGEAVNG